MTSKAFVRDDTCSKATGEFVFAGDDVAGEGGYAAQTSAMFGGPS